MLYLARSCGVRIDSFLQSPALRVWCVSCVQTFVLDAAELIIRLNPVHSHRQAGMCRAASLVSARKQLVATAPFVTCHMATWPLLLALCAVTLPDQTVHSWSLGGHALHVDGILAGVTWEKGFVVICRNGATDSAVVCSWNVYGAECTWALYLALPNR